MSRLARGPSFWGTGAVLVGLRMVVNSFYGGSNRSSCAAVAMRPVDALRNRKFAEVSLLSTALCASPAQKFCIDGQSVPHHAVEREIVLDMAAGAAG